jgi:replicative DNA helicase
MTKLKRDKKIKLAIVDYLQIMNWSEGGRQGDIRIGIVRITGGIKELARELGIPIILVSQVSRDKGRGASKNPRPRMSDLRESSSIENDADCVAFIYRPEYDNPNREDMKGTAELIIAKQRDGPTGIIKMWFEGQYMRFTEDEPESVRARRDGKAASGGQSDD